MNEATNKSAETVKETGIQFPQEIPKELLNAFSELLGRKLRENTNSVYANQLQFEVSPLDLMIQFGKLVAKGAVEWHTSVTLPWPQVKMLAFFLHANVIIHETTNGPVRIPTTMLPSPYPPLSDMETNPVSKKLFDTIKAMRDELIEEQKRLSPEHPQHVNQDPKMNLSQP